MSVLQAISPPAREIDPERQCLVVGAIGIGAIGAAMLLEALVITPAAASVEPDAVARIGMIRGGGRQLSPVDVAMPSAHGYLEYDWHGPSMPGFGTY